MPAGGCDAGLPPLPTDAATAAGLPMPACIEDLDARSPRGLDPAQLTQVIDLSWIREHLNVLITGPTGVGKGYLGAALTRVACRA